ncbi:MAG: hypothetical protein MUO77_01645 [Anaerolineales bacterium]|nr:hypothetical protein [Anaerolineales bacterium]
MFGFISALNDVSDLIANYGGNLRNSSDNCNIVLGKKLSQVTLPNNDAEQIKRIVQLEADATRTVDTNKIIGFFSEDSIIRDAKGFDWQGCAQIVQRYENLAELLIFLEVEHTVVDLKIDRDSAIATVFTTASYRDKRFPSYPPPYNNLGSYTANEIWAFRKEDNNWEIVSFTYNSILPIDIENPSLTPVKP